MLLLPLMFGCSKESNSIVGDWYICLTEFSDSSGHEYLLNVYTKENTIGFISYTADGKGVAKSSSDEGDQIKFHWTLSKDKLTITPEGTNQSSSADIIFEGNNKYYTVVPDGTGTFKMGWQRM